MNCKANVDLKLAYRNSSNQILELPFAKGEEIPLLVQQGKCEFYIVYDSFCSACKSEEIIIEQFEVSDMNEEDASKLQPFEQYFEQPYSFDDLEYYGTELTYVESISQESFDELLSEVKKHLEKP